MKITRLHYEKCYQKHDLTRRYLIFMIKLKQENIVLNAEFFFYYILNFNLNGNQAKSNCNAYEISIVDIVHDNINEQQSPLRPQCNCLISYKIFKLNEKLKHISRQFKKT